MLAATNAAAAEFSNGDGGNLAVAIMAVGYPVGAVVGGTIASRLLAGGDWRSVFYSARSSTAAFLPLVWLLLPETVAFLVHRRPAERARARQRVLAGSGTPVAALPAPPPTRRARRSRSSLLPGSRARRCC